MICIQPWFFSIGRLHFGHGLELANILPEKHHHFSNKILVGQGRRPNNTAKVSTGSCYKYTIVHYTFLLCFTGKAKLQFTQDPGQQSNSKAPPRGEKLILEKGVLGGGNKGKFITTPRFNCWDISSNQWAYSSNNKFGM